jgi:hypothetical protein
MQEAVAAAAAAAPATVSDTEITGGDEKDFLEAGSLEAPQVDCTIDS